MQVRLTLKAEQDLDKIYDYILTEYQSAETASNIINGILDSIKTLESFPHRCSEYRLNENYRVLFYKSYNIIFEIDDVVRVHSVLPSVMIN